MQRESSLRQSRSMRRQPSLSNEPLKRGESVLSMLRRSSMGPSSFSGGGAGGGSQQQLAKRASGAELEHVVSLLTTPFGKAPKMPQIEASKKEQDVLEKHFDLIKRRHNIFPKKCLHQLFGECGVGTLQWITLAGSVLQAGGWHQIMDSVASEIVRAMDQLVQIREEAQTTEKQLAAMMEHVSSVGTPMIAQVRELLHGAQVDESQLDDERPPPLSEHLIQESLTLLCSPLGIEDTSVPFILLPDIVLGLQRIKHAAVVCESILSSVPVVFLDVVSRLARHGNDYNVPEKSQFLSLLVTQVAKLYVEAGRGFEVEGNDSYIDFAEPLGVLSAIVDIGSDPFGSVTTGGVAPESPLRKSSAIKSITESFGLNAESILGGGVGSPLTYLGNDLLTLDSIAKEFCPPQDKQAAAAKAGGPHAFMGSFQMNPHEQDSQQFNAPRDLRASMRKASKSVVTMIHVANTWKSAKDHDSDEDEEEEEEQPSASELVERCSHVVSPVALHPGALVDKRARYGGGGGSVAGGGAGGSSHARSSGARERRLRREGSTSASDTSSMSSLSAGARLYHLRQQLARLEGK